MDASSLHAQETQAPPVDYQIDPARYRHWRVVYEGAVATLSLDVQEDAGIRPGYELKLNSYDLGVDIELHDAIERIRFEHPVRWVGNARLRNVSGTARK